MRFGARSTGEREIPTSLQARRRDSPCSSWATATDRLPSRRRRHQFFASSPLSAWLSSMASASSCLRRRFSSSSALSRLASDTFTPAYLARAPLVEGRRRDVVAPAKLVELRARLVLADDADDLLLGETALAHLSSS